MGLSCGSRCAKFLLFFFNLLVWIAACALLGVGLWLIFDPAAMRYLAFLKVDVTQDFGKMAAITMATVGGVIFLVAFLGCCGACQESPCMLFTYSALVVLLLLAQVAAGALAVVFRNKILGSLEMSMNRTVTERYGQANFTTEAAGWDTMQEELKCCGVNGGPSDWTNSYWYKTYSNNTVAVPQSCCTMDLGAYVNEAQCQKDAMKSPPPATFLHTQGCYAALKNWVESRAAILIGVAFGVMVIQILGVIMACCMAKEVRNQGHYA